MLNQIKINHSGDKIFFLGCFHHNHNPNWPIPLWKMRGFNSSVEHDEHQIKKWNEIVDNDSIVISLGDFIFSDPTGKNFLNILRKLKFKTFFGMPGNHFSGYKQNYVETLRGSYPDFVNGQDVLHEVYPLDMHIDYTDKKFVFIPNYTEMNINSTIMCLCHYAIRSWNKMSHNSWMVHSHEHLANLDSDFVEQNKGKIVDVGYESLLKYNDGCPISFNKLKSYMDKKSYVKLGHH